MSKVLYIKADAKEILSIRTLQNILRKIYGEEYKEDNPKDEIVHLDLL